MRASSRSTAAAQRPRVTANVATSDKLSSAARPIDRVAHDAQCSSRLLKEDVPGSRQLYSACCSLKQLYADLCFQLADHAGQRRLRDVKFLNPCSLSRKSSLTL